jgi:RNA polymerase sigma factor (sigma-70 family)
LESIDKEIWSKMLDQSTQNDGFRLLISKYKERLYWHIRRLVDDHDDADDILQNTFIKVFRNIDKYQGNAALYTWMYRIATNESLNFIQQNKYRQQLDTISDNVIQLHAASGMPVEEEALLDRLDRAIKALPDKQKLVFNMRYYDEMSYQDIADITDTSVGALKASYHHAVKKIEEYIISKS